MTTDRAYMRGHRDGQQDQQAGKPPAFYLHQGEVVRGIGPSGPLEPDWVEYGRGYVDGFGGDPIPATEAPDEPGSITLAEMVLALRRCRMFCRAAEESAMDPAAEQFYLLAIDALAQAQRFASLADLHETRARGEQGTSR